MHVAGKTDYVTVNWYVLEVLSGGRTLWDRAKINSLTVRDM
jgi:hypothetical protein